MSKSRGESYLRFRKLSLVCAVTLTLGAGLRAIPAAAKNFKFNMVRSPVLNAVADCVPDATGNVSIKPGGPIETKEVKVKERPPKTDFDFVIQVPNGPFGMSWYQGDIEADKQGVGRAKFSSPAGLGCPFSCLT